MWQHQSTLHFCSRLNSTSSFPLTLLHGPQAFTGPQVHTTSAQVSSPLFTPGTITTVTPVMPAAFFSTFISLCSCPLSSPNFLACWPWTCSLCQEAMPSHLFLQVSLTFFSSFLSSLQFSCHITDFHHKTDWKKKQQIKQKITLALARYLLLSHVYSVWASTSNACFVYWQHKPSEHKEYILWGVCTLPSTKRPSCNNIISSLQRASVRTLYYF